MLTVESITVRYGDRTAVDAVDLELPDGEVLALLGPSGCGKSTLLRAVTGLEPLAAGRIRWDGADLAGVPVHRRRFGLLFQDGVLFPHRSVAANIAYGLRLARLDRAEIARRVGDLLELVGLPGYGDRSVDTLSGGEAQRVALARSLAPRPRLLLLDEPLAALDRSLRDRLLTDLRAALVDTGTTSLFVTHDQGEAFAVADRVAVMRAGTIRQVGSPGAVWAQPADEWVARFLGYSAVVESVALPGSLALGDGARLALRPQALVLDPEGEVHGRVSAVTRSPEGVLVIVEADRLGTVRAIGPPESSPAPGDPVRLRFDRTAAAALPPDPSPAPEPVVRR